MDVTPATGPLGSVLPQDWFTIVVGIWGIFGAPPLLTLVWRRGRSAQMRANALVETVKADKALIDELERSLTQERARADAYDPHVWIENARNERKEKNEVKAVEALRAGVSRTVAPLQEAYLGLARHHLALYPDGDAAIQLREAGRLALIASLIEPRNRTASMLVEEIDDITRMQDIRQGRLDHLVDTLESLDPNRFGGGLGSEAQPKVEQLLVIARKLAAEGHYLTFEVVAHRARTIALCEFGDASQLTLTARYDWARSLDLNGSYTAALAEFEALLPIAERVLGSEHPHTLATRYEQAQVLDHLRRYEAALAELEALLPITERVRGSEHPDTLLTRYLKAVVLDHLGRYEIALAELEALLPITERVLGSEHPHTLATRYEQAQVLDHLDRYEAALAELEALLPITERVRGSEHPDTLNTRNVKAAVLDHLGRYEVALAELEALLPITERVLGSEHPDTFAKRKLLAQVREHLGQYRA
jgi:tetratricopeptide (TPR) repeat protein